MRIELPVKPPVHLKEQWEGQFSLFSYYAFVIDVPNPVFIVTTLKENGLANAALSAWGMPAGNGAEPKFLLQVYNGSDTRRLIERNSEFVVNYPSIGLHQEALKTVMHFDADTDELLASGLTYEPSKIVKPPRVAECFACLECRLEWMRDIETDSKVNTLVQAAIVHAAIDGSVAADSLVESHGRRQWFFHIQESVNPVNGAYDNGVFAPLDFNQSIKL